MAGENDIQEPAEIVDSSLTLTEALALPQQSEPPQEVLSTLGIADVSYYSFDGKLHRGQVVLHRDLLEDIKGAFDLMLSLKFPVFSVVPKGDRQLMDEEEKAKTLNNSCGFNYRVIKNTQRLSSHSLGRAIDINPEFNPFIGPNFTYPDNPIYDVNRPGTFAADDPIVLFFKEKGWEWGGDFEGRKDYMHFQKP